MKFCTTVLYWGLQIKNQNMRTGKYSFTQKNTAYTENVTITKQLAHLASSSQRAFSEARSERSCTMASDNCPFWLRSRSRATRSSSSIALSFSLAFMSCCKTWMRSSSRAISDFRCWSQQYTTALRICTYNKKYKYVKLVAGWSRVHTVLENKRR